jgi:hypothetical protein
MAFQKIQNFDQKSIGVSLWLYQKSLVLDKTDQNSVLLGRDPYIVDRLYIRISYIIFNGF